LYVEYSLINGKISNKDESSIFMYRKPVRKVRVKYNYEYDKWIPKNASKLQILEKFMKYKKWQYIL